MKFIKYALPLILIGTCANVSADIKSTPELLNGVMDSVKYLNKEQQVAARGNFFGASWNRSAYDKAKSYCDGRSGCVAIRLNLFSAMTIEKKNSNASQDYEFNSY